MNGASELQSVVRTMKAVAAASIGDYEKAVAALNDYTVCIERGLGACFRLPGLQLEQSSVVTALSIPSVVVFGSDLGLVGQFNERIAAYASTAIASLAQTFGQQPLIWAVGERVYNRLLDSGFQIQSCFAVPTNVKMIAPLVGEILLQIEAEQPLTALSQLQLLYQKPGAEQVVLPVQQHLLPLDIAWSTMLAATPWPTRYLAEILGSPEDTLGTLIREYVFGSMFAASAGSLASENASRLAAMQRADKNIEELFETLQQDYHRIRHATIDSEMFDVIAGARR
jgi:F-type H+-transporting ATPase subunit gamma